MSEKKKLQIALYCVLVPFWISVLVRTFSWMLLLERNGPVNTLLVSSGLIDKPLKLLFNDFAVHLGMVHVLLPYAVLPIYAAMLKVDPRLLLASDGLGATGAQTFWRIYLPLTARGVAAGAIFVFLLALGFYITPALLGGLHNLTVALLIDNFVNERLVWPLAAAASFILLAIILLILAVTARLVSLQQIVETR
jgi:putative spermidine/putrescine transport system permease protein